ncbi:hypothetical protein ACLOJK_001886 [Asimina triloba]
MAEYQQQPGQALKGVLPEKGPTVTQILAVITLVPIGGILLTLSGLALAGSVIGMVVTTPVFILFSPVIVPAAIVVFLAVAGFLASGAFGLTGLSSLSWIANYVRRKGMPSHEHMDHAKRRMMETAGFMEKRAREAGHGVEHKVREAKEGGRT